MTLTELKAKWQAHRIYYNPMTRVAHQQAPSDVTYTLATLYNDLISRMPMNQAEKNFHTLKQCNSGCASGTYKLTWAQVGQCEVNADVWFAKLDAIESYNEWQSGR